MTEEAIVVDHGSMFDPRPTLTCQCMFPIRVRDIEAGYHSCGRTVKVVLSPAPIGAPA